MVQKDSKIEAFKLWIFPSLVSILAMMIWNDVNEIKSDVKMLMAQSNIDKTRIDNLERQVYKSSAEVPLSPFKPQEPKANEYAVIPDTKLKTVKYAF